MRAALLDPLRQIVGVSDKLWSMILADLLLGADPQRERWLTTGSTFVAIDSLVHAFLHRTGILRRFEVDHTYGADCYAGERCADIIEGLASRIDASEFGDDCPSYFPRFIQQAIWRFCAQDVLNVCNGNRIDDHSRCGNWCCPMFQNCHRVSVF